MRKRGETLNKHISAEETAYRTLQRTLKEVMEGGHAEWSDDEGDGTVKKFKCPRDSEDGYLWTELKYLRKNTVGYLTCHKD